MNKADLAAMADRFDRDPTSWTFSTAMTRDERDAIAAALRAVASAMRFETPQAGRPFNEAVVHQIIARELSKGLTYSNVFAAAQAIVAVSKEAEK